MAKASKVSGKTEIELSRLGHVAFLTGIILAIIVGLFSETLEIPTKIAIAVTLIILGAVVGLLNITVKETTEFLVSVIALLATATVIQFLQDIYVGNFYLGLYVRGLFTYVSIFVAPAGLIVAMKAIYDLASKR